eukprot:2782881-Amphidinium_carterae.1
MKVLARSRLCSEVLFEDQDEHMSSQEVEKVRSFFWVDLCRLTLPAAPHLPQDAELPVRRAELVMSLALAWPTHPDNVVTDELRSQIAALVSAVVADLEHLNKSCKEHKLTANATAASC